MQVAQVIACEVLLQHVAVHGGRGTEGGHAIGTHLLEDVAGDEALKVVDKDRTPGQPLAIELAPHALGPAGFRNGEVKPAVLALLPVQAGHDMSQRIIMVMRNHLGHAGGAAGEVEQQEVMVVRIGIPRGLVPHGALQGHFLLIAVEALALAAQNHHVLEAFALLHGDFRASEHAFVLVGDDHHLDARRVHAVEHILFGQKMGGGHAHGAQLVQSHENRPEFQMPAENQHHLVALADAQGLEQVGCAVAFFLQLSKGITDAGTGFVRPKHGQPVGFLLSDPVGHVIGKVEALRAGNAEFLVEIIIGGEGRGAVEVVIAKRFHYAFAPSLMTTAMKRQSPSTAYITWGRLES